MKNMLTIYAVLMLAYTINTNAQTLNNDNVQRYIERYRSLAMSEQQRTGIPAAIKLAQGIHETGAGTSPLAVQANNHFGLKCKSGWTGATFNYTDDSPNECFRKYNLDFESYQDQSNYLKENPRYADLFKLSVTDYAAWAFGLRKAGYATNPKYPLLLIKIIEDYRLQEYTYAAMGNTALVAVENTPPAAGSSRSSRRAAQQNTQPEYTPPAVQTPVSNPRARGGQRSTNGYGATGTPPVTAAPAAEMAYTNNTPPERISKYIDTKPRERQTVTRSNQNGRVVEQAVDNTPNTIVKINNLKAVYGKKGDMPLPYAVRNGIRYEKFLEMNDLEDKPLPADIPLYLERKHFWGIRPMHLVKYGETMIEIAQKEGVQLKYLRDLNYMEEDEEPVPGITLELQAQAAGKPQVVKREAEQPAYTQSNNNNYQQQAQGEAYSNPVYKGADDNNSANNNYTNNTNGGYSDENSPSYTQPVSTFPKNPAPPYEEEKSVFEKLKETRLAKKLAKEMEALNPQQPAPAPAKQTTPAATRQQTPQPVAQQPVQRQTIQQPIAQQPEQRQTVQQPVQSYNREQYSYNNTNTATPVKPNPAAEVTEEKSARELRREARARQQAGEAQKPVATAPQQQKPKTELDLLKEQFDNVIYSNNTPANNQPQQRQQPAQQAYSQQPVQQPQRQQPVQQQAYDQPTAQQQAYNQQPQQTYSQQPQNTGAAQQRNEPGKYYTVKSGDTAYTIAKKHGITIRQLMDWNGLDFDAIKEGQNLRVKQ